jgi:DNA repair exonuclease SbcCD ATPase subunit
MIKELMVLLGGSGALFAAIFAMTRWVAKVTADRIARQETASIQEKMQKSHAAIEKQLQEFQAGLEKQLQESQAELEKQLQESQAGCDRVVHIHKAQFEKEFEAYQVITKRVNEVRNTYFMLEVLNTAVTEQTDRVEEAKKECDNNYYEAFNALKTDMENNMPFVSKDVYTPCRQLLDRSLTIMTSMGMSLFNQESPLKGYIDQGDELVNCCHEIFEAIRNRLEQLVVIE